MNTETIDRFKEFTRAEIKEAGLDTEVVDTMTEPYLKYGVLVDCSEIAVDSDEMLKRMAMAVVRTLVHRGNTPRLTAIISPDRNGASGFFEFMIKVPVK